MKKSKLHKLDLIFFKGIIIIGILGGIIDGFIWLPYEGVGGFPVYSCISGFVSYILWIILLIYSNLKYQKKEEKPEYVRWYMYFLLAFMHIPFVIIGWFISYLILNVLF